MLIGLTINDEIAQTRLQGSAGRTAWKRLKAVLSGEMYSVDHGILRNMIDYALTLYIAKLLYPDTFQDLCLEEKMRHFYNKYLPELYFTGTCIIELAR